TISSEPEVTRRAIFSQQMSLFLAPIAVIGGFLLDKIPSVRDNSSSVIHTLSILLLFFSTFNMFSALGGKYDASRIMQALRVFVTVRIVGLGMTVGAIALVKLYLPGVSSDISLIALAVCVLYYSPPSSLADDIFAVYGSDENIINIVKEDAATLNVFFV